MKRLIEKDYQDIVLEAQKLPEIDFYGYYLNIVEDNYRYNQNIIERLKNVLNGWIQWYNNQIYGGSIKVKFNDGTTEIIDKNQTFEVDKNGKRTPIKMEETFISLPFETGITRSVNRAFFEKQLHALSIIQDAIKLKKSLIEIEKRLPKPLKTTMPPGFDYTDLKNRWEQVKDLIERPQNKKREKKEKKLTFKDLFKDKDNAQKVKDLLEQNHYLKNGKWTANHKGNKQEFIAVYFSLKKKGVLSITNKTKIGKVFLKEFQYPETISDKALRTEPYLDYIKPFERLFYYIK